MDSGSLKQYLTGHVNGIDVTQGVPLGAAALMEIPIAMIVLSRVLKPKTNRRANIAAGAFMMVVQIASLFVGSLDHVLRVLQCHRDRVHSIHRLVRHMDMAMSPRFTPGHRVRSRALSRTECRFLCS